MTPPRRHGTALLRQSVVSVFDQAWLSLLNFGVGILLIRLTSPESYGIYVQLFAGGIFAVVIAESLLVNPLTTLASGLPGAQRDEMVGHVDLLHRRLSIGLSLLFGLVALAVLMRAGISASGWLAAAFTLYVYTSARREFQRSIGFIENQPVQVLRTDVSYGLALIVALAAVVFSGYVSTTFAILALAAANVWPLLTGPKAPRIPAAPAVTNGHQQQMWHRGRLGLPGAVSSWIVNYSYLYIVAAVLGATVAAELNASRLLLMPVSLLVVAWSRVARPMLSRMLARGEAQHTIRLLLFSIAALVGVTLAYAAVIDVALPWLVQHVVGDEYAGIGPLIGWWTLYFVLYTVRWSGSVMLLATDRYPMLLTAALSGLAVLAIALPLGLYYYGPTGAIAALAAVEVFTLTLVWAIYIPRTFRELRAQKT